MRSNWAYDHSLVYNTNIRNQGHIWLSTPDFLWVGGGGQGHQKLLSLRDWLLFLFFSIKKLAKTKISPSWRVVKLIKWTCHFVDGPQPHLVSKSSKLEFYTDSKMPSSFFPHPAPSQKTISLIYQFTPRFWGSSFFLERREKTWKMHWKIKQIRRWLDIHFYKVSVCMMFRPFGFDSRQISSFFPTKSPIQSQPLCISLNWTVTVHVRGPAVVGKKN